MAFLVKPPDRGYPRPRRGLSRLDRSAVISAGSDRSGTRGGAAVGRRRRRRDQGPSARRGRGGGDGPAEEGGHDPQGPVPVPRREDPVVRRDARARDLALLRVRQARRHLHVRDGARLGRLPRGAQGAGRPRRRGARRADQGRGRPQRAPPVGPRERDRLLPRGPAEVEGGRAGPRVPARPGLHRRDHREAPAGLGARRLGHARPPARRRKRQVDAAGAARGGPREPAPARRRRLRPVPRAGDLPDPRRERAPGRAWAAGSWARRARAGGHGPQVPQLARDPAVRQEPHAVPHRPRQDGDPQDRPGRDRRGLHRRADGPPGGLRERRREPRHRAHARARSR